jgi:hypothetical protein
MKEQLEQILGLTEDNQQSHLARMVQIKRIVQGMLNGKPQDTKPPKGGKPKDGNAVKESAPLKAGSVAL